MEVLALVAVPERKSIGTARPSGRLMRREWNCRELPMAHASSTLANPFLEILLEAQAQAQARWLLLYERAGRPSEPSS